MPDGHVFVTMGNLIHVHCDAWLLPTDSTYSITSSWRSVDGLMDKISRSWSDEFASGEILAQPVSNWDSFEPLPILTAVPLQGVKVASQLIPAVEQFVRTGAEAARVRTNAQGSGAFAGGRPLPLLAMPSFGTAGGGGNALRGDVLRVLLDTAAKSAREHRVDVVLVFVDSRSFALAQVLRKKGEVWNGHLRQELLSKVTELAALARDGRLVPFMGAGVSMSAGAPDWKSLIAKLAADVGLSTTEVLSLTKESRNVLDQAAYLRAVYEDKGEGRASSEGGNKSDGGFGDAIAKAVSLPRYGLTVALLASLKSDEAITLNYDQLFEMASADAGDPRNVIPDGSHAYKRWLLKLHGSVTDPTTIVLTRDDYLGFNASREALSAIVKATLITRHLLFVGFGLADDHFHQIVHDVRRAVPPQPSPDGLEMATALTLHMDPLDQRLWQGQLALVPMGEAATSTSTSARILEIFLDALLANATDSHSYLLAPEFGHALDSKDLELKQALLTLADKLTPAVRETASFPLVRQVLSALGWPDSA